MDGTVFEHIMAQTATGSFDEQFVENLKAVYEYDATDIQDFLLSHQAESDEARKEHILSTRQMLFTKLCEKLPALQHRQLYNRRKPEIMAADVYYLGNSLVNGLTDKRLHKVLKPARGPLASQGDPDESIAQADQLMNNADVVEMCAELKTSVSDLVQTVKNLTKEIGSLKQQIDGLKQQRREDQNGESSSSDSSDEDDDAVDADDEGVNNILLDLQLEQAERGFQLSSNHRREARRGGLFTSPERQEIRGSSSAPFRIQSADNRQNREQQYQSLRSVYVGQLAEETTTEMIRDHLQDIGVSQVSDVINLNSTIPGQSSFCIVVDNARSEKDLYDPDKWPSGIRVRPYKERKRGNNPGRRREGQRNYGRGDHQSHSRNQGSQRYQGRPGRQSQDQRRGSVSFRSNMQQGRQRYPGRRGRLQSQSGPRRTQDQPHHSEAPSSGNGQPRANQAIPLSQSMHQNGGSHYPLGFNRYMPLIDPRLNLLMPSLM